LADYRQIAKPAPPALGVAQLPIAGIVFALDGAFCR